MSTARHTNRQSRTQTTRRVKRSGSPEQRRRGRITIGVGLVLFAVIAMIIAGAIGGPASLQHGDMAVALLGLGALTGLGGFAAIVWGLTTAT